MVSKSASDPQADKINNNRVERSVEGYLNNFEFQTTERSLSLARDVALFEVPQDELRRRQSSEVALRQGDAAATWKVLVSAAGQSFSEVEEKIQQRFREVLNALRLLKAGGVEIRTFYYHPGGRTGDEGDITNEFVLLDPMAIFREGTYRLEIGDLSEIEHLLEGIAETTDTRVRRALHRFNVAYLDYRDDDKLIDNVIALEALLLPESQELGLRLAMRSACLLAEPRNRETVFEFVRLAYKYRSDLVHGGEPHLPDPIKCGGMTYAVHEFIVALQNLVRKALRLRLNQPGLFASENLERLNPFKEPGDRMRCPR